MILNQVFKLFFKNIEPESPGFFMEKPIMTPESPSKKKLGPSFFFMIFILIVLLAGGLYFYFLPPAPTEISLASLTSSSTAGKNTEPSNLVQATLKPSAADYQYVQKTYWIEQGDPTAPQKMYVVIDPNCIFCHELFNELQPLITDKKVCVRWIIIGAIRPSSPDRAQAIFTAKDPLAALIYNESNFKEEIEEGGIPAALSVSKEAMDNYEKNMRFIIQIQLNMTPIVFFFDAGGNFVRHDGGALPKQFVEMMKHVGDRF
jgi:protein-disulfide isomerase